jgi:hypothetical protein
VEPVARKIIAGFQTVNPTAGAWRVLALAALKSGDLKKAEDAANHASKLALQTPNVADFRLPIAITAARVAAASGRTQDAIRSLNDALQQAVALHLVALQLEARLALSEIQKDPAQIALLHQDAERMGFRLVAAKAAKIRNIP